MKKNIILIFMLIGCLFSFSINVNAETNNEVKFIDNKIGVDVESASEGDAYTTCRELFGNGTGSELLEFIQNDVLKIIWIGVPLLLILLTSYDFAKVVFGDEKDGMKTAFNRFTKRAVAAILIYLTPYIILLIANLIDPTNKEIQDCVKEIRDMKNTSMIINYSLTK